jgi:phosphotransferase system enzyme I (PtsI)
MRILQGIPVSPGVVIGETLVLDNEGCHIPRTAVARADIPAELTRFEQALAAAGAEIERNRDSVSRQLGDQLGGIFAAHLQILLDPRLRRDVAQLIREHQVSAEHAVHHTLQQYGKVLQQAGSQCFHDILDLEKILLRNLLGHDHQEAARLTKPVVVLAHNLTPSETAGLDRHLVLGFVTEIGAAGGHTAILARGMEIPAVVGTGRFLDEVACGDLIIIDGGSGRIILQPDAETLAAYGHQVERQREVAAGLRRLRDIPAETQDGVRIRLLANIEFPHEVSACEERGADGIGLYRTEFLYLGAAQWPSEEDHYQAYKLVLRAMAGKPVVIRTVDLGADKVASAAVNEEEKRNPFLGLRSIRLALRTPELFRPQVRAILRASAEGDARIMFPLVSTLQELRAAKAVVEQAMEELTAEGQPFQRAIPIGMMVESPAAATLIDRFLREVSFISIGTNDLIQYTLAVDRSNPSVADLYQAGDPAVLRLIAGSVQAAVAAGVTASLCGQMSGEPIYTMLLLGIGLRELSVPPSDIPEIKRVCRAVTVAQCEAVAATALRLDTAREVDDYLKGELQKLGL